MLRTSLYYMYARFEHHAEPLALAVAEERMEERQGEDSKQRGSVAAVRCAHGAACHGVDG